MLLLRDFCLYIPEAGAESLLGIFSKRFERSKIVHLYMTGLIVDGKGKLADKEVLETIDKEANDEAEYEEDEMEDDNLEEDVDADVELDPIEFWRPIATQKALMSTVMATLMSFVCSNSRQSCFTIPSHFVILLHQSSSGANLSESHRSSFRLFLNRPIDKDCQRTGF
ncbi:hypothetical protein OROHE_000364 [Orobanche hederae]